MVSAQIAKTRLDHHVGVSKSSSWSRAITGISDIALRAWTYHVPPDIAVPGFAQPGYSANPSASPNREEIV
jgi:hypothetical protein